MNVGHRQTMLKEPQRWFVGAVGLALVAQQAGTGRGELPDACGTARSDPTDTARQ